MDKKNLAVVGGILGLFLLIGVLGVFYTQGSIVEGSKVNSIKFMQVTEDAGVNYDPSSDYPVLSDSAVLGDYSINVNEKGAVESGDGCMMQLDVSNGGVSEFSGKIVNGIAGTPDQNLQEAFSTQGLRHGSSTLYMDYDTWYGNGQVYVISQECGGGFLTYEMPVQYDQMSFGVSAKEQTTADNFTASIEVTNNWRPLQGNFTVNACTDSGFCATKQVSESIPTGQSRINVVMPTERGNLSLDMSGDVSLDLDKLGVSGLNIRHDGEYRDASEVSHVKIAEVTGSGQVQVIQSESSESGNPGQTKDGEISTLDKILLIINSWFSDAPESSSTN